MTILQNNLQIQCDPYQITNGIFHRTSRKFHNLYGNIKDPEYPQQTSEGRMELEDSTFLISDYTTKLQSRQYDTGTKTEIFINGAK